MKQFSEADRLNAEKYARVSIPGDPEESAAMLSWKELHDERSSLRKAGQRLLDLAKKASRDLTPDEERAFDVVMGYLDALQDEFDGREISGQKEPTGGDRPYKANFKSRGDSMNDQQLFTPRKKWRDIFKREPRKVEGLKNFGEAVCALHEGNEEKLRELRTMNTFAGEAGGFSIPEVTWSSIYDSGIEASACLDKVTTFPMTSDTLHIPAWDSADKSQGAIGAVAGAWIGETDTATRVSPRLRVVTYTPKKLAMYIACSSEVLQDGEALSQSLGPLMRNSLAFSLDSAILTGTGIAQPLGVINSPAAITVDRATAGTIAFADITGMMGRLYPSSLNNAVWICSPSTFGLLVGMVTAAGSGELIMSFQPGASDFTMQILGRPVRCSEKLPAMAQKGSLMLLDLTYYGLAMRETGRMERTNSAQWTSDCVDFRLIVRADGKPLIDKPFTPAGGGSTLSPFVILDE